MKIALSVVFSTVGWILAISALLTVHPPEFIYALQPAFLKMFTGWIAEVVFQYNATLAYASPVACWAATLVIEGKLRLLPWTNLTTYDKTKSIVLFGACIGIFLVASFALYAWKEDTLLEWGVVGLVVSIMFIAAGSGLRFILQASGYQDPDFKKCPDCAETVKSEANICKHCGYRFDDL